MPATAFANARAHLLGLRNSAGHWEGRLSESALSTATAVMALRTIDADRHSAVIQRGLGWLQAHANADGGFGDTTASVSNLSTSVLVWAVYGACGVDSAALAYWIERTAGSLEPAVLAEKIADRYGRDRTFSVPILMMAALGGRLGPDGWKLVMPLPFELAAFPRRMFSVLKLPVVSYALPALIAIGQARHHHVPPGFSPLKALARGRTSRLLAEIQPSSGGYLEATPLTSFVCMALASSGQKEHPVLPKGEAFLLASQRADGSWPIDTNLSTWVTTSAVKALDGDLPDREIVRDWLMGQQYQRRHPFTDSPPGGWAWTDLPGGVPDADDTAGAMLALRKLGAGSVRACLNGAQWLAGLQNKDGGIPTFCRGWGTLPFDRSAPDLTAHALRAWGVWLTDLPGELQEKITDARLAARSYLAKTQSAEGSWTPLWFGNQHHPAEENPVYGTTAVCAALPVHDPLRRSGIAWLLRQQNADGGWGAGAGTPSTIEETALALEAICPDGDSPALRSGLAWLLAATENGTVFPPSPIGFYFARLWYSEQLYPVIWTVSALRQVCQTLQPSSSDR